jgi:hypothetical protein
MYQFVLCSAMKLSNQSFGTVAWFALGIPIANPHGKASLEAQQASL